MADATTKFAARWRRAFRAVGIGIASSAGQADASTPTISSGAGAPTATEPNGSLFLRTDAASVGEAVYGRLGGGWGPMIGANPDSDPGDAGTLQALSNASVSLTSAGAGETRTLADPAFVGQALSLIHIVDGGDIAVTAASAINKAGNTGIAFADVDDFIHLVAVDVDGAGDLEWRVVQNDGCTLS